MPVADSWELVGDKSVGEGREMVSKGRGTGRRVMLREWGKGRERVEG